MVPVNTRPLAVSSVSAPGTFTFRKDSAGLGVPRDFGELRSISSDVAHHGQANTEIERSAIGPSAGWAHRGDPNGHADANGRMANGNANRGPGNHDYTPGSRSVSTFTRADMHANGANGMDGWSHMNNGMNNGVNNEGAPGSSAGASPRGTWQRPEGGSGVPRPQSAPAPSGGGSAPASGGGSHK